MTRVAVLISSWILAGGIAVAQQPPVTPTQDPTTTTTTDPTRDTTTNPVQNPGVQSQTEQGPRSPEQAPVSQQPESDAAGNEVRIEGCVTGPMGGSYLLTSREGKKYTLRGDYDAIHEHAGHLVTVVGVRAEGDTDVAGQPDTKPETPSGTETPATGTAGEPQASTPPTALIIDVDRVEMVSEACDIQAAGPSGTTTSATLNQTKPETPPASAIGGTGAATTTPDAPSAQTGTTPPLTPAQEQPAGTPATSINNAQGQPPAAEEKQDQRAERAETTDLDEPSGQVQSISGCLRQLREGETLMVKANRSGRWVEVEASENLKGELSRHIGKEVRLIGEFTGGDELPQADRPADAAAGEAEFRVNRIDLINNNCKGGSNATQ